MPVRASPPSLPAGCLTECHQWQQAAVFAQPALDASVCKLAGGEKCKVVMMQVSPSRVASETVSCSHWRRRSSKTGAMSLQPRKTRESAACALGFGLSAPLLWLCFFCFFFLVLFCLLFFPPPSCSASSLLSQKRAARGGECETGAGTCEEAMCRARKKGSEKC